MTGPTNHVTGSINVTRYSPKPYDKIGSITLLDVDVTEDFAGGLVGTGRARFLMVQLPDASAYFTGIERFAGTLADRQGGFLLRNTGILKDDVVNSEWLILPGSATGSLPGLRGTGGTGPGGYFLDFWFASE
jgi:hypothetical protein